MGALTKTLTRLKKLEPLQQAKCAFPGKQVVPLPAKLSKVLTPPEVRVVHGIVLVASDVRVIGFTKNVFTCGLLTCMSIS